MPFMHSCSKLAAIPEANMLLLIGDFSAKLGCQAEQWGALLTHSPALAKGLQLAAQAFSAAAVTAASAQARLLTLAGLTAICIAHSTPKYSIWYGDVHMSFWDAQQCSMPQKCKCV